MKHLSAKISKDFNITYLGRKRRANQKERQLRSRRHKYEHKHYISMKPEKFI